MIIFDYIVQNYVLLIMIIGMAILTIFDVFLDKRMLRRLRLTLILLFAMTVFDYLEVYMSTLGPVESAVQLRTIFAAACYTIRPAIVMLLVFIVYPNAHWAVNIPVAVNLVVSFSSLFSDIAFTITPDNTFRRGTLGYTPYVVIMLYIALLFMVSFRVLAKRSFEEGIIIMFLALGGCIAAFLTSENYGEIVNLTYGAEILLYYLYIYGQYTKRDTLTGLYNRQSFYSDMDRHRGTITGIISIDMNELKWMNDNFGHNSGDKALKTVSECFTKPATPNDRIYRVGGDEFIVICRGRTAEEVEKLTESMRREVDKTEYSCAFGYSVGKEPEVMVKEADAMMYSDKEMIKAARSAKGETLHLREAVKTD